MWMHLRPRLDGRERSQTFALPTPCPVRSDCTTSSTRTVDVLSARDHISTIPTIAKNPMISITTAWHQKAESGQWTLPRRLTPKGGKSIIALSSPTERKTMVSRLFYFRPGTIAPSPLGSTIIHRVRNGDQGLHWERADPDLHCHLTSATSYEEADRTRIWLPSNRFRCSQ